MNDCSQSALAMLAAALVMDWLLGEFPLPLHPVVWLGKVISLLVYISPGTTENRNGPLPYSGLWYSQLFFGAFLVLSVCGLGIGTVLAASHLTADLPWLEFLLGVFFLKASFALRELGRAAYRVLNPLERGDLAGARQALRSLCSRDPSDLGAEDLIAATIESIAENASDSFVAPLFYFVLFGVPGAMGYRAINTLDAMVGYRGRFEALGKVAARLDDVANWIPARVTAGLLLLAGWLLRYNVREGWRIMRRDGAKTPSPNGGRPMAVMAGLLGVALEKKAVYVLGDPGRLPTLENGRQAWRLVTCAAAGMVILSSVGLYFRP